MLIKPNTNHSLCVEYCCFPIFFSLDRVNKAETPLEWARCGSVKKNITRKSWTDEITSDTHKYTRMAFIWAIFSFFSSHHKIKWIFSSIVSVRAREYRCLCIFVTSARGYMLHDDLDENGMRAVNPIHLVRIHLVCNTKRTFLESLNLNKKHWVSWLEIQATKNESFSIKVDVIQFFSWIFCFFSRILFMFSDFFSCDQIIYHSFYVWLDF